VNWLVFVGCSCFLGVLYCVLFLDFTTLHTTLFWWCCVCVGFGWAVVNFVLCRCGCCGLLGVGGGVLGFLLCGVG